ncbi:MAG: hypothetical protein EAZ30_02765 [Betaproteobacteria bacterium]|nr:MAG: hypothetical protein EAZ30_02765 [Betaproteobacteria bacterium]
MDGPVFFHMSLFGGSFFVFGVIVYTLSIKQHELNLLLAALRCFQENCARGTAGHHAALYDVNHDTAISDIDALCEHIILN